MMKHITQLEGDMMKHITQISCRRMPHCRNEGNRQACVVCWYNKTGSPRMDNYKEKIPGIKYL